MTTNVPAQGRGHATSRPTGRRVVRRHPVGLCAFVGRFWSCPVPLDGDLPYELGDRGIRVSVSPLAEVVMT